jgi:hypothetical protein
VPILSTGSSSLTSEEAETQLARFRTILLGHLAENIASMHACVCRFWVPMQLTSPSHDVVLIRSTSVIVVAQFGTCRGVHNCTNCLYLRTRSVALLVVVLFTARTISQSFWFVTEFHVIPFARCVDGVDVVELTTLVPMGILVCIATRIITALLPTLFHGLDGDSGILRSTALTGLVLVLIDAERMPLRFWLLAEDHVVP